VERTLLSVGATLALLLGWSGSAVAGPISYDYQWDVTPEKIHADPALYPGPVLPPHAGKGTIHLEGLDGHATGSTGAPAARIWVTSKAPYELPAHFTKDGYTLSVTLTDKPSGKTGVLTFEGQLSGKAWYDGAKISNKFIGPKTETIQLGDDLYTVKIGPYLPPGHGKANAGGIGATISVEQVAPEPSTLALAGFGLTLTGLATWRKRRAAKLAALPTS
jgi:hypothetical protein